MKKADPKVSTTFTTHVKAGGKNATGLPIPAEAVAALGMGKKPPVKVSLNGYTYRSTLAVMGGVFMLPLSAENREAAGVKAGDKVEVTLELDTEPRTVEVPDDLAKALAKQKGAKAAFEALAFSKRKEFVRQVNEAKAPETRTRRIEKTLEQLASLPPKK